jgi:hypothetical protein
MKKLFATCLVMAMFVLSVHAYDLWFTWTASPVAENVTSYVLERATLPSTNFIAVVTVSGTTNVGVIKGLTPATYKFRVIAKNGVGSSPPSNVLTYPTNSPSQILDFQFTVPR